MTDRNRRVLKGKTDIEKRYELGEVTISHDDTVTFSQHSSTEDLLEAYFIKKTTGAEMTCDHDAANIVTITGTGTDIPCLYLAWGFKA
jgi:hypothetical protein